MSVRVPTYRKKKTKTGILAVVTLPDGFGGRRDVLLGKYGTAESRQEYVRIIAEWESSGRMLPRPDAVPDITIAELIGRYWSWVQGYYRRPDSTLTQEVTTTLYSLRPLNYLYGGTLAREFGPLSLKAVRDLMIHGYEHPKYGPQSDLSRGVINQRVKIIRRLFRWAVAEEIVPAHVLHGLQAVQGLKQGRTEARETDPVLPVSRATVEDTLAILRPMIADMVRLQLETGMRPGELVIMRASDIDVAGKVWLYRPGQHKTLHHGHGRIVPIGPKGQEVIRRNLVTDTQSPVFSPARNMEERRVALRKARKSKVQPSQHTSLAFHKFVPLFIPMPPPRLSGWSKVHYQCAWPTLVPVPTPFVGVEQGFAINLRSTPTSGVGAVVPTTNQLVTNPAPPRQAGWGQPTDGWILE
jgi:integrase